MFSENQKISSGQLKRLVVLELFGKGALLLPFFADGMTAREFLLSILLVFLLLLVYCRIINALSRNVRGSFFEYLKERLGKWNTVLISVWALAFLVVNVSYLFRAFGTLGHLDILPDQPEAVLMLLALLGAAYLASGGVEVRGRTAEIWYPLLIYPMLLLLLFSGLHMEVDTGRTGQMYESYLTVENVLLQAGVFGELTFFLLLLPQTQKREKGRRAFLRGTSMTLALLFVLFLILAGTFGKNGMEKLSFPVISLMSTARIPGGFLERWDTIFTGLLLMGLLIGAGGSLHVGSMIGQKLLPKMKRRTFVMILGILGYLAALASGSYERNAEYYGRICGYFLVPGMAAVVFLLLWIEKIKRRKRG